MIKLRRTNRQKAIGDWWRSLWETGATYHLKIPRNQLWPQFLAAEQKRLAGQPVEYDPINGSTFITMLKQLIHKEGQDRRQRPGDGLAAITWWEVDESACPPDLLEHWRTERQRRDQERVEEQQERRTVHCDSVLAEVVDDEVVDDEVVVDHEVVDEDEVVDDAVDAEEKSESDQMIARNRWLFGSHNDTRIWIPVEEEAKLPAIEAESRVKPATAQCIDIVTYGNQSQQCRMRSTGDTRFCRKHLRKHQQTGSTPPPTQTTVEESKMPEESTYLPSVPAPSRPTGDSSSTNQSG